MARKKPDQKKLQTLLTRIESAENWRDRNYREKWTKYYKLWRNHVDQLKDKAGKPITDRSNISVPYAFTMLETVLPRLVVTLFAGRPYVTVKGIPFSLAEYRQAAANGEQPWEAAAEKMQKLLDHQQTVSFDMQDEFHTGLKILGLYGTSVAYTGWRLAERKVIRKELQPVMEDDGNPMLEGDGSPVMDWQAVEISKKEYDDPEVKFLDLGLFYVDPNAEDIDDARYAGHIEYLSKTQLQEMETQGLLSINWKAVPKNNVRNEARSYRMNAVGIPVSEDTSLDEAEDMDLYEVHHYWEDDRYAVLINRGYIARDSENPFWHKKKPYDKDVYTKVPNEFHGLGIMEMVEDLQLELNTERNQRIDYRSYTMRRMFKVNRNAEINPAELVWRQGGVIRVESKDDVDTLDAPDVGVSHSFQQEGQTKQDMRDVTGAHDVVMGTNTGASNTATETMTKDNNASTRFKLIISSVEQRLLVAISRKMIQLNQQFIDDIRLLPLFEQDEQEWPEISPEEIQGEFHLIAAGSSVEPLANKEAFKQRMVELYSIVVADPFMQEYPHKRRNLLKKVFDAFDIQDTDELLPTDEELSGMMEQQLFQQIMARLPPEVQQLILQFMDGGAPQQALPPSMGAMPMTGANTSAMQEQGMPMMGGVGL